MKRIATAMKVGQLEVIPVFIKIPPTKEGLLKRRNKSLPESYESKNSIRIERFVGLHEVDKLDKLDQLNHLNQFTPMDNLEKTGKVEKSGIQEKVNNEQTILPQFRELYNLNSDIIGWIRIDGTNINYPIMYTPEDGEYYLHRNIERKEEKRGLPFLDGNTNHLLSQNYLIYGHNMRDGTAFHDLLNYTKESFYKEHTIIHFDTLYEDAEYEIIAVFKTQIFYKNDEVFKYYNYKNITDITKYQEYIENIKEKSLYDTGITSSFGEDLLTLSTCSYHVEDGRFVVVARKRTKEKQ